MTLARHVLVTRPPDDAADFARALTARGWQPVIAPLLKIRIKEDMAPPLRKAIDQVAAILVTSSNGVRALAKLDPRRHMPVLAVGPVTASVAKEAGFTTIRGAEGDVAALAEMAMSLFSPAQGALLHITGSVQAGDLAAVMAQGGFTVHRLVLYEAEAVQTLPESALTASKTGRLAAVTLFSPRTAANFVALIRAGGLASLCRTVAALCLSEAVAEEARALPWKKILSSERRDSSALLDLLPVLNMGATES